MSKIVQFRRASLISGAILLSVASFSLGSRVGMVKLATKSHDRLEFSELNKIYNLLQDRFDGSIDAQKAIEGAKLGLTAATGDPYTSYLDAKNAKALKDDLAGTLTGIGAEIGIRSGNLVVIAPINDSPASKAGLRAKDIIIKINDQDATAYTLDEAVHKIRGKEGTEVKLLILRATGTPFEVKITRAVINVPSVKWSIKNGSVGYIEVSRFGDDTSTKIAEAAADVKKQGAKKIILDLRNDPGGYLEAAVKVAGQFLDNQLVVEEKKGDKTLEKLSSDSGGLLVGLPTVVLINGGSASASEIVAGALQDHKAAQIVGEKSFGKGSVQEVVNLPDGAELKITVAHWYTPNGKNIGKEGIKPDIEVKREAADFDAGRDPQLDKALELLK